MPKRSSIRTIDKWIDRQFARYKQHPNKLWIDCFVLFMAGFLEDFILSYDTLYTAWQNPNGASATSFTIVVLQVLVLRNILDDNKINAFTKMLALAFGCAIGANVAIRTIVGLS